MFLLFKVALVLTNYSIVAFLGALMVEHYKSNFNLLSFSNVFHVLSFVSFFEHSRPFLDLDYYFLFRLDTIFILHSLLAAGTFSVLFLFAPPTLLCKGDVPKEIQ